MLHEFFSQEIPDRVNFHNLRIQDSDVNRRIATGKIKTGLTIYLKSIMREIIEDNSRVEMLKPQIEQLQPEFVRDATKAFLNARGYDCDNPDNDVVMQQSIKWVLDEVTESLSLCVVNALNESLSGYDEKNFHVLRQVFPSLADISRLAVDVGFMIITPDEAAAECRIHNLLISRHLAKPSDFEHAVMFTLGCEYNYVDSKQFLLFEDLPDTVRINPLMASLNRINYIRPQGTIGLSSDERNFKEDSYRHHAQSNTFDLMVECISARPYCVEFNQVNSSSDRASLQKVYQSLCQTLLEKPLASRVSDKVKANVDDLKQTSTFYALLEKVKWTYETTHPDIDIIDFASYLIGNTALKGHPKSIVNWLAIADQHEEVKCHLDNITQHICEHAYLLEVVTEQINAIAKRHSILGAGSHEDHDALCALFRTIYLPRLSTAISVSENADLNDFLVMVHEQHGIAFEEFFHLVNTDCPRLMLQDLITRHPSARGENLQRILSLTQQDTCDFRRTMTDKVTHGIAGFLAQTELLSPGITKNISLEMEFSMHDSAVESGTQLFLKHVNKDKTDSLEAIRAAQQEADMSFLERTISI
jgi:hypothetical protein